MERKKRFGSVSGAWGACKEPAERSDFGVKSTERWGRRDITPNINGLQPRIGKSTVCQNEGKLRVQFPQERHGQNQDEVRTSLGFRIPEKARMPRSEERGPNLKVGDEWPKGVFHRHRWIREVGGYE